MLSSEFKSFARHCTNPRFVENPYTHEVIKVNCGHCSYCLNQKSSHGALLCAAQQSISSATLFVTLTYANEYIPTARIVRYVDAATSEIEKEDYDSDECILEPNFELGANEVWSSGGVFRLSPEAKTYLLKKVDPQSVLPSDSIPVLRKRDISLFMKRLRRYVDYKFGSYAQIHHYIVGEYGPIHLRPHFHLLLFFEKKEVASVVFKHISSLWKLGRCHSEFANKPSSSYVGGYVNSLATLPYIYKRPSSFRPFSRRSNFFAQGIFLEGSSFDGKRLPDIHSDVFEKAVNRLINGVDLPLAKKCITVKPWRSLINRLFGGLCSYDSKHCEDFLLFSSSIGEITKILARFGYFSESALDWSRCFVDFYCNIYKSGIYAKRFTCEYASRMRTFINSFIDRSRLRAYEVAPYDRAVSCVYRAVRPLYNLLAYKRTDGYNIGYVSRKLFRLFTSFHSSSCLSRLRQQYTVLQEAVDKSLVGVDEFIKYVYNLSYIDYKTFNVPVLLNSESNDIWRARNCLKHKKLNDSNLIFCYNLENM